MKKFFAIPLLLFILVSCSTKRNTFVSRSYHNLTSHYNAYFNGNEAYKQGIKKIYTNPSDNYALLLNVFPFLNEDAISQASSDMQRAKDKAAIVIKKHSITAKPERKKGNLTPKQKEFYNRTEYCNWVPDAWLMHGKANFVNHDWYAAEENFEYIIKEYSWDPIKHEAAIWLAMTYVQLTKYDDARALLDREDGDKDFPKKLRNQLYQAYAQLHIKQQNYSEAISKLTTAIKLTSRRQEKARMYYILAQLYQLNKNLSKASQYYTYAIKYSNRYEMTFNAQINRATCFEGTNAEYLRKELFKMLKDDKNIDYYDQIYYAIANLYYKENQLADALKYYKLSLQNNKSNENQKAVTYLALGDIYFNKKDYVPAQAYYDSSITLLDKEYPEYKRIEKLANNLSVIAENLKIIQTEDSLQLLAKMPEKERLKIIDDIIQKILDEEKRQREEEQQQAQNMMFMNPQNTNNPLANQTQGGKWYFYNPSTLALGAAEFKRKWGNRKLEDDWRRKNKSIAITSSAEDTMQTTAQTTQQTAENNPKQREYYLKNLPLNDSLMKLSNQRIEEALFKSGEAAMNQLEDYQLAIKQFVTLIDRFPNTSYKLLVYYDLYKLNLKIGKDDVANLYRQKLIQEFPESQFAQLLTNPNYLKELEQRNSKIKALYEEAFNSFKDEDYPAVFRHYRIADSLYNDSPVYVKFKLLNAMAKARTGNFNEYKSELTNIIEKYPGTQEKSHAEHLLATINNYDPNLLLAVKQNTKQNQQQQTTSTASQQQKTPIQQQQEQVKEEADDPLFVFDEKDNHQFIILLDKNADINRLKYNLFGYNIDYFSMFDFQILNGIWNDRYFYIKVFPFANYNEAVKYYKHVNKNTDVVFRTINEKQYHFFVISDANYTKLQSNGEIERYIKFFKKKYLKKKNP